MSTTVENKNKNWRVSWEGTVPEYKSHDAACVDLWVAKFVGAKCHIYCAADPGAIRTEHLTFPAFRNVSPEIQKMVLNDLRELEAMKVAGMVFEFGERPEVIRDDKADTCHLSLGYAEIWLETKHGLSSLPYHSYTVGINTGDDFVTILDTQSRIDAAVEMATIRFKETAKEKLLSGE